MTSVSFTASKRSVLLYIDSSIEVGQRLNQQQSDECLTLTEDETEAITELALAGLIVTRDDEQLFPLSITARGKRVGAWLRSCPNAGGSKRKVLPQIGITMANWVLTL